MKGNEGDAASGKSYSHEEHGVSGWGSSWATMARPIAMIGGDDAVDALGALILGGLEVAGGVLGDGDVGSHPAPWSPLFSSVGFRTRGPDAQNQTST